MEILSRNAFLSLQFYNLIYVCIHKCIYTHTYILNQATKTFTFTSKPINSPLKKKKKRPSMVLITSVASLIISFWLGYLINMSVWSSAFFAINIVQAREAEGWFHLCCVQQAAIKAEPSKWSLFNIRLISSTVRYWRDLLGSLVQFAGLLAKGLLWCSVNPFNPSLVSWEIMDAAPWAPTFLSNFSAVSQAAHGCKSKAHIFFFWPAGMGLMSCF